jgi:hypothetical protein
VWPSVMDIAAVRALLYDPPRLTQVDSVTSARNQRKRKRKCKPCSISGCPNKVHAGGCCRSHYDSQRYIPSNPKRRRLIQREGRRICNSRLQLEAKDVQLAAQSAQLAAETAARVALEAEIARLKGGSLQSASMPMPLPPPPPPPSIPLPPTVQTDAAAADRPSMPFGVAVLVPSPPPQDAETVSQFESFEPPSPKPPSMPLPPFRKDRNKKCESCLTTRPTYGCQSVAGAGCLRTEP